MTERMRRVVFEGPTNFRDLGGYPSRDGREIKWGVVYRADALHALTEADRIVYDRLGIRTIYDLRGDAEREAWPNPYPSTHLSILSRVREVEPEPDRSAMIEHAHGERMLRGMYLGMLQHAAPLFAQLLGDLAAPERVPAVFHCAAGKDRTGLAAALLLEALGVEREVVLDDYELTGQYRLREQQAGSFDSLLKSGMSPEAAAGVLGTPRWAMEEALHRLDSAHGGIEVYLTEHAGMSRDTLHRLRDQLLA